MRDYFIVVVSVIGFACLMFGAGFMFGGHDVRAHIRVAAFDTRHTYGPYYGDCPMDAEIVVCAVNTRSELKGEIGK